MITSQINHDGNKLCFKIFDFSSWKVFLNIEFDTAETNEFSSLFNGKYNGLRKAQRGLLQAVFIIGLY